MNEKIDFTKWGTKHARGSIKENEMWLPAVQLKAGIYSDVGYRFRENKYSKTDHWFPLMGESDETFYDCLHFSSDELNVDMNHTKVAELFIRLKTDRMFHERRVFSFIDWLGSIGGIEEIFTKTLIFLFGGYA